MLNGTIPTDCHPDSTVEYPTTYRSQAQSVATDVPLKNRSSTPVDVDGGQVA